MTTPFLYCMLDLILGYYVPPATIDEGNLWNPNPSYHPPMNIGNDLDGYDEAEDMNEGEGWQL